MASEENNGQVNIGFRKLLLHLKPAHPGKIHIEHHAARHFGRRGGKEFLS
jgi:hypothetical protein